MNVEEIGDLKINDDDDGVMMMMVVMMMVIFTCSLFFQLQDILDQAVHDLDTRLLHRLILRVFLFFQQLPMRSVHG